MNRNENLSSLYFNKFREVNIRSQQYEYDNVGHILTLHEILVQVWFTTNKTEAATGGVL